MNDKATSGKEVGESVDEKRARFERFGMTVCRNGYVNVENQSYGDDSGAHIYSVRVENGEAVGCSCPHAVHRGAHCKHQVAVENRPLVVSSATAAGSTAKAVATDGGRSVERVRVAEEGTYLACRGPDGCGARTGRPVDMSHHIDLHHPEAENPLPRITHHTEPAEVGGQRYARCEGCGSESIHGATRILHESGCALHK